MTRLYALLAALALGAAGHAQEAASPAPPPPSSPAPASSDGASASSSDNAPVQLPPEEDQDFKKKVYTFNPLEAAKDVTAGNFYYSKGRYVAAKSRYQEATLYDPGSLEAFRKLGEADEKLHDFAGAREAYDKFINLAKDPKDAKEVAAVRKRMSKLPAPKPAK